VPSYGWIGQDCRSAQIFDGGGNILILKCLRTLTVFCLIAFSSLGTAYAKEDPNLLMGEAIRLHDEAQELTGGDRTKKLLETNELLSEIERDHPDNILANFIKAGRAIGAIDVAALRRELGDVDESTITDLLEELPEATKEAISSVAQRACAASDCAEEVATSLAEVIFKIAFTDLDQAVDVEKLKWLFSNPGQLGGNLERVQVFEQMLDNPDILADIDARITQSLLADIGKEAAKDFAIGLVTNVATEVVAGWLEDQGKTKQAQLARTWVEPSVDIGLALQGAATATTASAGAGAAVIWAKNAYAFVQLGQKTLEAEASGSMPDQQLAKIASDIDSLHRSLLTGRTTGPLFAESLDVTVTPRMAEVFRQALTNQYEYQKYWLASDDVILLEAFEPIIEPAKIAAKALNKIVDAIPEVPGTQPSGTENANSTNALPGDINLGDNPSELVDQNLALDLTRSTKMPPQGDSYWLPPSRQTDGMMPGETDAGITVHSDNRVTWNDIAILPPFASINPSYAMAHFSPEGDRVIVFQTVYPPEGN
jgi:hypothetical protein